MLNCLLLSVGWLYWGTLHWFYKVRGVNLPGIYGSWVRIVLILFVGFMAAIIVFSLIETVVQAW